MSEKQELWRERGDGSRETIHIPWNGFNRKARKMTLIKALRRKACPVIKKNMKHFLESKPVVISVVAYSHMLSVGHSRNQSIDAARLEKTRVIQEP